MRRRQKPIVGAARLEADLVVPARPSAVVLHLGVASGVRGDPVTRVLVEALAREGGLASYVVDLVADDEIGPPSESAILRLEIPLLAQRLSTIVDWASADSALGGLPIVLLASGNAAGPAIVVASARREVVAVIVTSGRPDLAAGALEKLRTPTLLIVDEQDDALLASNRSARARIAGPSEIVVLSEPRAAEPAADVTRHVRAFLEEELGLVSAASA